MSNETAKAISMLVAEKCELITEKVEAIARAEKAEADCAAMRTVLQKAVDDTQMLINESRGVDGWHLNGDIAAWGELEDFLVWIDDARQTLADHPGGKLLDGGTG